MRCACGRYVAGRTLLVAKPVIRCSLDRRRGHRQMLAFRQIEFGQDRCQPVCQFQQRLIGKRRPETRRHRYVQLEHFHRGARQSLHFFGLGCHCLLGDLGCRDLQLIADYRRWCADTAGIDFGSHRIRLGSILQGRNRHCRFCCSNCFTCRGNWTTGWGLRSRCIGGAGQWTCRF
ncbi:hypothetical protein D3C87_1553060 [compost metagenome]